MKQKLWLLFFLLAGAGYLQAQVPGCTDPQAQNYNSSATQNDGSCQYSVSTVAPTFLADPLANGLEETSGLVCVNGALWTHNDSGGDAAIYRIDEASGAILQTVYVSGATNKDWESLAADSSWIYIGDFGNNNGTRTDLRILRIPIPALGDDTLSPDTISFHFPEQTDFSSRPQAHEFDCEAFWAMEDSLFLLTKRWNDQQAHLYILPNQPDTASLPARLADSLNTGCLVTGADFHPASGQVVAVGYDDNGFSTKAWLWVFWDFQPGKPFSGNKRKFDYGSVAIAGQVEAVALCDSFEIRLTNEQLTVSPFTISPKLHQWNNRQFLVNTMTSIPEILGAESFFIYPNPVTGDSRFFLADGETGWLEWEVRDMQGKVLGGGSQICEKGSPFPFPGSGQMPAGPYLFQGMLDGKPVRQLLFLR